MKKTHLPGDLPDETLALILRRLPRSRVDIPDEATVLRYVRGQLSEEEAEKVRAAAVANRELRTRLVRMHRELKAPSPVEDENTPPFPVYSLPIVGRGKELDKLRDLVLGNRVVTVVGGAGVGKSRLVHECAQRFSKSQELGVYYVDASLIACEEDFRLALDDVDLGSKLLVLDDLKEPYGLPKLLRQHPDAKVLATSRQALGLPGEKVFDLKPMKADDADALDLAVATIRRFFQDFQLTAQNRPWVQNLIHRAMGVPLGLILVASSGAQQGVPQGVTTPETQVASTPEAALLSALDDALSQLSESDRQNLRMLAAFDGSFTAEEASFVLDADASELLAALELKGLVQGQGGTFRIHDSIGEHLRATLPALEKHAALFADRAEAVGGLMAEGRWKQGVRELFANNANFRCATKTVIAKGNHPLLAKLTSGLARFYLEAGCLADYQTLADAAYASAQKQRDLPLTIKLLGMQGALAARNGDDQGATRIWENRAELCREAGDLFGQADSLTDLALHAFDMDDFPLALGYLDEAQTLSEKAKSWELVASAQSIRARFYAKLKQAPQALRWLDETRKSMAKSRDRDLLVFVHQSIAMTYQSLEMKEETFPALLKLLSEASEGHRAVLTGWALRHLGPVYEERGDLISAAKAHTAAVAVHGEYATKHRQNAVRAFEEFQERHGSELAGVLPELERTPWSELVTELLTDTALP